MLFGSYTFLIFFVLTLVALKSCERLPTIQRILLLAASYLFYGYWDYRFLALVWISSIIDYGVGLGLGRSQSPGSRKLLLATSVVANLSILGFFKYFNFFQDSAEHLLAALGVGYQPWLLGIVLPVGISFYTFQTIGYSIDVYRGDVRPCKDALVFFTFVAYFPQLVAGPIERAGALLPQLSRGVTITGSRLMSGGLLILWGLFKKSVIADFAGIYLVDPVFANPTRAPMLTCGIIAFAFQIYCDFSGYCDIARGASRCLGIELTENFKAPYFATSITDFWRRWHITLSSWFRDYLYIPLGGNRNGLARTCFNLLVTMLLCGLWHGAAWKFLLWGGFHGMLLFIERGLAWVGRRWGIRLGTAGRVASAPLCFGLVCYGWLIFRIDHISQLGSYTSMLLSLESWSDIALLEKTLLSLALLYLVVIAAHWIQVRTQQRAQEIEDLPLPSWSLGLAGGFMCVAILLFGTLGDKSPFLYFQF
jgi:D-alanyl-lipoteichoic acid acyltransferase DltB (MBOAT superfamily)